MLFNSPAFIFIFLPITLLVFLWLKSTQDHRLSLGWLVAASLVFYGWWNPQYVLLIMCSIAVNYVIGVMLDKCSGYRFFVLSVGVVFNLVLLGYYKYTDFFIASLNDFAGTSLILPHIILPLAISFVTFQQIAYIVDAYRRNERARDVLGYCLFVTFFPQLIAGPIVHHKEMIPQFLREFSPRKVGLNIAVGTSIFAMGLFKKMVLADSAALYASPVFDAAANGFTLTFFEAWSGALAYTFQIYFDFSGYCDMAMGLALMFGVRLPINFASPYQARSIIDFWRRWHMTLSRFLRDYLYFILGGGRNGKYRRYVNVLIVMILGGVWHGAGWTFLVWGILHGLYLLINHAWRDGLIWWGRGKLSGYIMPYVALISSRLLTMLAVVVAWVFFRASDLDTSFSVLKSMAGGNGISLQHGLEGKFTIEHVGWLQEHGVYFTGMFYNGLANFNVGVIWIVALLLVTQFLPNTQTIMRAYKPGLMVKVIETNVMRWRINMISGIGVGVLLFFAFSKWFSATPSEFIYFNF